MTLVDLHPALHRVLREARRARERRGALGSATVRLGTLRDDEARELDALLAATGWRRRVLSERPLDVPLARIEAALEAVGHDPRRVYADLAGGAPMRDIPAERRADAQRRDAFWAWLGAHPVLAERPALRAWLDDGRRRGLVRPSDRESVERALRVVAALPPPDPCDRAVLAATVLGDPHGLDDDERVGRIACAMLRADAGLAEGLADRAVWAHAGVLCDTTSSTVLTLGLAPAGDDPLAVALRALRGRHVVVTLGQIEAASLVWPDIDTCYVCENPSVLRAAERRLAAECPPMVCTEGWPSDAARLLLRELSEAGWELRHHGDFDLGGIAIMRHLRAEAGAAPWRFDAESYERALATLPSGGLATLPRVAVTASDALEKALVRQGRVVSEEHVLDELLGDLAPR